MIVIAVVAGILVGISLGALGGGGAIITVPVLVYVLGQSAHEATTSSLVIVGVTAFIAAITHACAGRVRSRRHSSMPSTSGRPTYTNIKK